ncbi:hypothetical protein ACFU8R_17200 [Pseudonocardia alni]|jgi:hypothetical protein|uniref:Uncharacterized protein n=1 Tax=Pseudonocardia alni TaxID=33907 RepID=A0A852W753_PSEA5|nr:MULTISPECIES: hypothetical protein [Pseudonocardia]OJG05830.1 hypothetical protein BG618_03432 [Pseudonocardia autotrophica]MCO7193731.1 hypothetical protein [Pseudonocardia sp. McavD-2-B]MYW73162.1 hypothetical protein [Pseudonocardia sp. SID8383]NYG03211.1 hypothetical protein [Pseudonocardia antarctica]PKB31251.1 hypothetical protein ATL51_2936 [Pseudonocardia alni]
MYFRITPGGVELVDPGDVRAFHVVVTEGATEGELADTVRRTGLGELSDDGEHVLVRVDAVRRLAAGRVGPGWEDDLAGMLGYARSKGWLSDDGTAVRAHVERA